jgi:hypothetical protein
VELKLTKRGNLTPTWAGGGKELEVSATLLESDTLQVEG